MFTKPTRCEKIIQFGEGGFLRGFADWIIQLTNEATDFNAAQLLSTGNFSVTEVAERCGYSDSNYFASVFKKFKGTTPLKFSKSQM